MVHDFSKYFLSWLLAMTYRNPFDLCLYFFACILVIWFGQVGGGTLLLRFRKGVRRSQMGKVYTTSVGVTKIKMNMT